MGYQVLLQLTLKTDDFFKVYTPKVEINISAFPWLKNPLLFFTKQQLE